MKRIPKYIILGLLLLLFEKGIAQPDYTFGLNRPLSEEYIPKSKVPFENPVRVPKKDIPARLEQTSNTTYKFVSGWELCEAIKVTESLESPLKPGISTDNWYNAVVPGTVLTSLVQNGVYLDPYWGVNNLTIPDTLCRMDWWYRIEFDAPDHDINEHVRLIFDGINYRAEVWFNGSLLGNINGAFVRGVFDITRLIQPTENVLAVRIIPPNNPGISHEQNKHMLGRNGGLLCLDGPTFISSEGWDWVPGIRDRNIGLWQDVKLDYTGSVYLGDSQVITDLPLPDTTEVALTVKTLLTNKSAFAQSVELTFDVGGISVSKNISLASNTSKEVLFSPDEATGIIMENPKLWWPNGYGEQNLYTANLIATVNGKVSDRKEIRFGVRELDYEIQVITKQDESVYVNFNPIKAYRAGKPVLDMINRVMVDEDEEIFAPKLFCNLPHLGIDLLDDKVTSPYLVLKVNGVRVFCKGGNWGMDDAMKNVSREHLEPYLKLHKDQNFNMIRNWTGESTESVFYDLCDEYGILVFNDFWLSTEGYNLNAVDERLFMANVNETIIRHRNHPSIAIWCPRNEGFAPDELEKDISRSIAALDGTRHYIGSSIKLNTTISGPWTPEMPLTYYNRTINRGFNSEIGAPSVPTAESMRKMMAEEDLWPISDVWSYHTWLNGGWLRFQSWEKMVSKLYGDFTDLDDFCKKSQLFGYDVYRAIFEAANSRIWDNTTGVLLWMSHPAWPSMAYQTYTWDYETTGPYYGSKDACEPIHIQMRLDNRLVQIINNTEKSLKNLLAEAIYYNIEGKKINETKKQISALPNSSTDCYTLKNEANFPDVYLLRLVLKDSKNNIIDQNDYWLNGENGKDFQSFNSLSEASLAITSVKKENENKYSFTVRNIGKEVAIGIKLNLKSSKTGASILPAYFSEGYFTMLPGERKVITLEFPQSLETKLVSVDGYNVPYKVFDLSIK